MNCRLSDSAIEDMQSAIDHYLLISRSLAGGLIEAVADGMKLLRNYPYVGRSIGGDYRRLPIKRYSFFLIYRVDGECISIVSIYHQRRSPDRWRNRIQEAPAFYQLAA